MPFNCEREGNEDVRMWADGIRARLFGKFLREYFVLL